MVMGIEDRESASVEEGGKSSKASSPKAIRSPHIHQVFQLFQVEILAALRLYCRRGAAKLVLCKARASSESASCTQI